MPLSPRIHRTRGLFILLCVKQTRRIYCCSNVILFNIFVYFYLFILYLLFFYLFISHLFIHLLFILFILLYHYHIDY